MTIQWSTTLRNALLDQFETSIGTGAKMMFYTGSAPANCATAPSGTKLAEIDLDTDWMSAAASGSKTMIAGGATVTTTNTYDVTALATGSLGYYRVYANDGTTCHEQGSITATGGGGDLTVDNVSLATGQHFQITGYTKNAAGA